MASEASEYDVLLEEVGKNNVDVLCIDMGLATSMKTERFAKRFPDRYFNLGIAEQNAVGVASGLARQGFIPLVHTFSNFLVRRAHDQIALSVAWPKCNVKLIGGSCGVFDGRNGPSHMSIEDLGVMASLPEILVTEPGDRRQTEELLQKIVAHQGPAYLRLRRYGQPGKLCSAYNPEGTTVIKETKEPRCTLVVGGTMLEEGIGAHKLLQDENVDVDLIQISILRPLSSKAIIGSAHRSGFVVTVENHVACGGYGDAVSRVIGPLGIRNFRISLPDEFIPAGPPNWQLAYCGLDAESICETVLSILRVGNHLKHSRTIQN